MRKEYKSFTAWHFEAFGVMHLGKKTHGSSLIQGKLLNIFGILGDMVYLALLANKKLQHTIIFLVAFY